jgi:hypothetical protein
MAAPTRPQQVGLLVLLGVLVLYVLWRLVFHVS